MYMDLPTDVVRPAPDNLRRRIGDVSGIVASIPTHGIIEPLVVAPQDDGTYLIVAGHRRHAAAVKAGLATVPCIIRPMSDDERVLAALIENGLRNDLRPSGPSGIASAATFRRPREPVFVPTKGDPSLHSGRAIRPPRSD